LAEANDWIVTWFASDSDRLPDGLPATLHVVPMRAWNGIERQFGIPWPVWSFGALRQLSRAISRADVVHLHDALYFGNAWAWLFARLWAVPVIVTQHVGSIPYPSGVVRIIHALANRSLGRLVLSTAERVVFISPAVRDEFSRFCRFRDVPACIPNGVDTSLFNPQGPLADDPAIAAARGQGRRVFLFVGRFVAKKGLPILRELAAACADDLWLFAGRGEHDPDSWGLPNVLVVRDKSGAGLAPYYRAADLLVLPSVGEGFPLVVQESMACGTPAMVGEETAAGYPQALPLLLVEKVGAGDTAARWIRRLTELQDQPERLSERRPDVAAFAGEHWSWHATGAAYAAVLDSILSARRK
jgi:glycosyltransferase involved in cell wall biosynthesis